MKYFIAFFFLSISVSFAQDFQQAFKNAASLVKEVKLEKETISQELLPQSSGLFDLLLVQNITDSKGKSTKTEYVFNPAFFNSSGVAMKTSKTKISVLMKPGGKFKAVSIIADGKSGRYTDEVEFVCDNADEARELEKALKEVVIVAGKEWESSLKMPESLDGLMSFLQTNIKDFEIDGNKTSATFSRITGFKDRVEILAETSGSKSVKTIYELSLGDLNEKEIEAETTGSLAFLTGETKGKSKYIGVNTDGKFAYDSDFKIPVSGASEAKALERAFQKIIPLAAKELEARLPKPVAGKLDGLKQIADFEVNGKKYSQEITPACVSNYKLKSDDDDQEEYDFNFGDLKDFEMKVGKDLIVIAAETMDNLPFIEQTVGEKHSFAKKMEFHLGDVDKARYLMAWLPEMAKGCKTETKAGNFKWLTDKINDVKLEDANQKLELQDGGEVNKWKFTQAENGSKKSTSSVFEWNIQDIDASKSEFTAKGANLILKIYTKGKEKLIKKTVDDKPTYAESVEFILEKVEDAKKARSTISALAGK